ncbi:synaptic vesicle 2-related protein-like [Mercenaria mercenaria]|uniref:synaptic vesicle 2-related protein-like n=1 Tax=Mercenaria mercenaria TaxID=6596 RepID=UPI00234EE7C6|nr:synaptic vesicle 2-related protein-like [Mercenaria mercenaria]
MTLTSDVNKPAWKRSDHAYATLKIIYVNFHLNLLLTMDIREEELPLTPVRKEILLDDVLSTLKFGKFHFKMLILTCGAYFSACAEMMLIVFLSKPIKSEWNLDDMIFPLLPFCCGIISLISSFTFGSVSDKFGRQRPLLAALISVAVFGISSAFAPYFWTFVILRAFVSFGTSGIETVDFVLLLEFLPKKNRGCTMVVITLCGAFGALCSAGLAWVILPRFGWRWFVGACAVPSCIVLAYRLWFKFESPRYLYISGQRHRGLEVLKEIAKQNNTNLPEGDIVCPPSPERGRVQDLFSKKLRGRTVFSMLVWFFQSMGFWGVTMYLPEYLGSIDIDPYFNMFAVYIGEIPGLCLTMVFIEHRKLGRVRCLRLFSFSTAIGLLLFAFINVPIAKTVFVVLVYFFMVPIYSILNTYTPELYPTDSRSIAIASMYMVIAFPGIITAFIGASVLSTNITWLYPTVAAGFFSLQFLFTFGLTSETAGRSLNDTKQTTQADMISQAAVTTPVVQNGSIGNGDVGNNCDVTDASPML